MKEMLLGASILFVGITTGLVLGVAISINRPEQKAS